MDTLFIEEILKCFIFKRHIHIFYNHTQALIILLWICVIAILLVDKM